MRRALVLLAGIVALVIGVAAPASAGGGQVLLAATFPTASTVVTNEYAYWNPTKDDRVTSPVWEVTSGSLFARNGTGWTGAVDDGKPDARSTKATNSSTFRMRSRARAFGDVALSLDLSVLRLRATASTPAQQWDGVHLWLRYQSERQLYAVSVARRDGRVVIKKKCPGGPSNGGAYYSLGGELTGVTLPLKAWRSVIATVDNNADGSVTLAVSVAGRALITATDTGVGCAPLRAAGAIGIRGDNTEFQFRKVTVRALAG